MNSYYGREIRCSECISSHYEGEDRGKGDREKGVGRKEKGGRRKEKWGGRKEKGVSLPFCHFRSFFGKKKLVFFVSSFSSLMISFLSFLAPFFSFDDLLSLLSPTLFLL
jgi:hypothetical protein